MSPLFREGSILVALINPRNIFVGDIVFFHHDGLEKVKRVASVQADGIKVVGDNRNASTDSRHFGLILKEAVFAKVIWPRQRKRI